MPRFISFTALLLYLRYTAFISPVQLSILSVPGHPLSCWLAVYFQHGRTLLWPIALMCNDVKMGDSDAIQSLCWLLSVGMILG